MKVEKDDWLNEILELAKNWVFGLGIIIGLAKMSRDGYFYGCCGRVILFSIFLLGVLISSLASYKFFSNVFCFNENNNGKFSPDGLLKFIAAIFSAVILSYALNYAVHLEAVNNSMLKRYTQVVVIFT